MHHRKMVKWALRFLQGMSMLMFKVFGIKKLYVKVLNGVILGCYYRLVKFMLAMTAKELSHGEWLSIICQNCFESLKSSVDLGLIEDVKAILVGFNFILIIWTAYRCNWVAHESASWVFNHIGCDFEFNPFCSLYCGRFLYSR